YALRDANHVAGERVGVGCYDRLCQPTLPHDGAGAGTDAWRRSVETIVGGCDSVRHFRLGSCDTAPAPGRAAVGFLALTRGILSVAAIALKNVTIQIPIYDIGASSLRKMILSKTVGGRFEQSGSHLIVDALKDISFESRDGDRVAVVGNNGSGKST